MASPVRVRRRRSTLATEPPGGADSAVLVASLQRVQAAKAALASFSLFPQFVQTREIRKATIALPVERVSGIVATWMFVGCIAILTLVLLVQQLAFPPTRTESVMIQSLSDYERVAEFSPSCPCAQTELSMGDVMAVELVHDPVCDGDAMGNAAKACSRSLLCAAEGNDRVLSSMAQVCTISQLVQARLLSNIASRRVVSPQLMTATQLASLGNATAFNARREAEDLLNVPYGIVDSVMTLERPMTIDTVLGQESSPTTPVVRSAGLTRMAVQEGDVRRFSSFSFSFCSARNGSRAECEALPACRWHPDRAAPASRCDSTLCPVATPREDCDASPSCVFFPDAVFGGLCLPKVCSLQPNQSSCISPLRGAVGAYQPQQDVHPCEYVVGPRRTSCNDVSLTCGDFATQSDCQTMAPRHLCAWNGSTCGWIDDWTCPGGQPRSNCSVDQAVSVRTNDVAASYLLSGPFDPAQEPAAVQPDILAFGRYDTSRAGQAPLWRLATTNSCSCFSDFDCARPQTLTLMPGEPTASFSFRCTRTKTVSTYTVNILSSSVWTDRYGLPAKPTTGESAFGTFGEAFQYAFLVGSRASTNFSAYFGICRPATCAYTTSDPPSFIALITYLLSVIGGLSLVVMNAVQYSVIYVIGPYLIKPYVEARPGVFGVAPPEPKVTEILARAAADVEDEWEEVEEDTTTNPLAVGEGTRQAAKE